MARSRQRLTTGTGPTWISKCHPRQNMWVVGLSLEKGYAPGFVWQVWWKTWWANRGHLHTFTGTLFFKPKSSLISIRIRDFSESSLTRENRIETTKQVFWSRCLQVLEISLKDSYYCPHLCAGFLFLILYPASAASFLLIRRARFHTPSLTHNFVTHNFVTHHLSHSHHLCHPQLWHKPSFTFTLSLSYTIFHTQLCHTPSLTHTMFHTPCFTFTHYLCDIHLRSVCVAGVVPMALGWLWWRAWQAWHLATHTFTLRGRRGTYGTGLALVARLGAL